ncbi:MAG: dTDP-4-dehydrorhamnose reductase [Candidatus Spechtbacterales bacterium]|nr:dTDP-4-dehydrorhamnose reductase [Candidatus Spechtbacterales bacterium]
MKIVIFGANGLLGKELKNTFKELSPYSFDKGAVDITDHNAVSAIMTQLEPDVVINAAAYTDVDGAEDNPELAEKVNTDGVKNIADCAKENNSIMVHYSTDYIFDGTNKEGYNEDDIPMVSEPLNVYGKTKLKGEKVLRNTLPRHYIIRTSWLFGGGGSDFVDKTIQLAKSKKEIKAAEDQHSKPTYVKDLAQATRVLLSEAGEEMSFGTYHITNESAASRLEWVEKIVEIYAKKNRLGKNDFPKIEAVSMDYFKTKAKRPAYSVLNNNKFIKIRPWQEALEEYLASPIKGDTHIA